MNKQNGFVPIVILLGIVLTVVIAGGAYYLGVLKNKPQPQNPVVILTPQVISQPSSTFSPSSSIINSTPQPIASSIPNNSGDICFKKFTGNYTDTKYGFTITLPAPFEAFTECPIGSPINTDYQLLINPPPPSSDIISLKFFSFTSSTDDFVNYIQNRPPYDYFDRTNLKTTLVGGKNVTWIKAIPKKSTSPVYIEVYLTDGTTGYYFQGDFEKDTSMLEQILSTFKFTQ